MSTSVKCGGCKDKSRRKCCVKCLDSLFECYKRLEEKRNQNLNGMNPFTFSKLKSKEFVRELLVQKVSKLIEAWFTLKAKVKKMRSCPVKQLKLFAVQ